MQCKLVNFYVENNLFRQSQASRLPGGFFDTLLALALPLGRAKAHFFIQDSNPFDLPYLPSRIPVRAS